MRPINADQFPDSLRDRLPWPIARAVKRVQSARNDAAQSADQIPMAFELVLRTLCAILLAEIMMDDPKNPLVKRDKLNHALKRPTTGTWRDLLETLTDKPSTFMPEARGWYKGTTPRGFKVAAVLRELIEWRNKQAHNTGESAILTEQREMETRRAAFYDLVCSLDWLQDYVLFFVRDIRPQLDRSSRGIFEFFRGPEPDPTPTDLLQFWGHLGENHTYLWCRSRNQVLATGPYITRISVNSHDRLAVLCALDRQRKTVTVTSPDGLGDKVTSEGKPWPTPSVEPVHFDESVRTHINQDLPRWVESTRRVTPRNAEDILTDPKEQTHPDPATQTSALKVVAATAVVVLVVVMILLATFPGLRELAHYLGMPQVIVEMFGPIPGATKTPVVVAATTISDITPLPTVTPEPTQIVFTKLPESKTAAPSLPTITPEPPQIVSTKLPESETNAPPSPEPQIQPAAKPRPQPQTLFKPTTQVPTHEQPTHQPVSLPDGTWELTTLVLGDCDEKKDWRQIRGKYWLEVHQKRVTDFRKTGDYDRHRKPPPMRNYKWPLHAISDTKPFFGRGGILHVEFANTKNRPQPYRFVYLIQTQNQVTGLWHQQGDSFKEHCLWGTFTLDPWSDDNAPNFRTSQASNCLTNCTTNQNQPTPDDLDRFATQGATPTPWSQCARGCFGVE